MLTRMKKSLGDQQARTAVLNRLRTLTSDNTRRWGRMPPPGNVPSERLISSNDEPRADHIEEQRVYQEFCPLDRAALGAPVAARVKTMPEVDQEIGGTKPVEFERDKRELEALIEQFAQDTSADLQPHPIFGRLSTAEWQRWGYLHMDHHLRQFGK